MLQVRRRLPSNYMAAAGGGKQINPTRSSVAVLPLHQFSTLFIRAVRVRRFETLSRQDFFQFVSVGLVCGMIW